MGRVWFRIYAPDLVSPEKHSYYIGTSSITEHGCSITKRIDSIQVYYDSTLKDLRRMIDCGLQPGSSNEESAYYMRPTTLRSEILFVGSNAPNVFQRDDRDRTRYGFAFLRQQQDNETGESLQDEKDTSHYDEDIDEVPQMIEVEDDPIVEIFGQFTLMDLIIVPLIFVHPSTNAVIDKNYLSRKHSSAD